MTTQDASRIIKNLNDGFDELYEVMAAISDKRQMLDTAKQQSTTNCREALVETLESGAVVVAVTALDAAIWRATQEKCMVTARGKIYVVQGELGGLGGLSQKKLEYLNKLSKNRGVTGVRIGYAKDVDRYVLVLDDTEACREFLKKYIKPDGRGLTDAGEKAIRGITKRYERFSPVDLPGKPSNNVKKLKWSARGLGMAFNAWAVANFISDINNLGEAAKSAAELDGVSVQTLMPDQYSGQVSPADQKYFTKGTAEELKFRAMVAYAGMQEGGFMGRTQEEWQEYAVRLSQAEGGIISPQAELKIRKALVEQYSLYQNVYDSVLRRSLSSTTSNYSVSERLETISKGRVAPEDKNRSRRGGYRYSKERSTF